MSVVSTRRMGEKELYKVMEIEEITDDDSTVDYLLHLRSLKPRFPYTPNEIEVYAL